MPHTCTNCGATIDETAVRYERTTDGDASCFCSLNCLTATDQFDESDVTDAIFEDDAPSDT